MYCERFLPFMAGHIVKSGKHILGHPLPRILKSVKLYFNKNRRCYLKRAFLNKLYVYIHTYIKFLSVWMNMYIKIVYEFYVVIPRPFSLRNQYTS